MPLHVVTMLAENACCGAQVIYINSADYTAWAYRWQCLEHLGNLESEMAFINEMASRSPKNYQLWNHRRRVAFKRTAQHAQQVIPVSPFFNQHTTIHARYRCDCCLPSPWKAKPAPNAAMTLHCCLSFLAQARLVVQVQVV